MKYCEYFNIDPDYFPQVDKKIIDTHPDLWKKFYPHPSFVTLLKRSVEVISRKQKLSIWVDGAYGTGKSHAVLTLKKLLEASEADTEAYFTQYGLDTFLCKQLTSLKNDGKILVCHRYGSSDIESDTDLIVAIQEGVEKALAEAGIDAGASVSLKNALIRFMENEENKQSFDIFAKGTYKTVLGGDTADSVLEKLRTYQEDALRSLIEKIFKVPLVSGAFKMNSEDLCGWLREIITKNQLKELFFIWDEFSEYFENNIHHLTGFQQIAELSATAPFCLLIVTHKAEAYFSDSDPDKKKILDRFCEPVHISLPENIAFELMAHAMQVTDDIALADTYHHKTKNLEARTMQSRSAVTGQVDLKDKDLINVLPIHPYAALLLQHISVYYTSTARSMFNFIKNDEGDDVKAFQWFIRNYDFSSPSPFVTVDMLWNFFYESSSDKLNAGIREVLGSYTAKLDRTLMDDEKRVLKTILLLQAVSDRMTGKDRTAGKKDIFLPNEQNLRLVYEGTDLANASVNIARKMLRDHVITRTPLTGDVFSYCCKNTGNIIDTTPFIPQAKAKSTKDMSFMPDSGLRNYFALPAALKLRYSLTYSAPSDLDQDIKKAHNPSDPGNKIFAVAAFARDNNEGTAASKKIKKYFEDNPGSNVVIIDSTSTHMTDAEYKDFVENYAMALAIGASDINERKTYEGYALEAIKAWSKRIKDGPFYVYSRFAPEGEYLNKPEDVFAKLSEINRFRYPSCPETSFTNVLNTMYDANALGAGALCGIDQETKGTYKSSNDATKLENALKGAWKVPEYWKASHNYIAELKKAVDNLISSTYKKTDRISIASIYSFLKAEPYGFLPCNLTAFLMGFLLKEYADGTYSYSDNLTTVTLDSTNLSTMISEIIKLDNTPDRRYKDKFIVTLTAEERAFYKATSVAFGIDEKFCVSMTETRSRIRDKMKGFAFPIWSIEYVLGGKTDFATDKKTVETLIELYCGIANNRNLPGELSDQDIAQKVGSLCMEHPGAETDLQSVLTKENCKAGMQEYLKTYKGSLLPSLAKEVNDGGQYINHLSYKFSSDAANWVWNKDTVNQKIDEVITEYNIIALSNKVLVKHQTYIDTITEWKNKIGQICISFPVMKNDLDTAEPFFKMLYDLKKQGQLLDSQKKPFLDLLDAHIDDFRSFMSSQSSMFVRSCEYYLQGLTEEDTRKILEDDSYNLRGSFMDTPDKYIEKAQKAIEAYKNGLKYVKLRNQWKELTGTESPMAWSAQYNMPILAMVPGDELPYARAAFETINTKSKDDTAIDKASDYIAKMPYLPELISHASRDKKFRETFLASFSALFDSVDKVKEYLRSNVPDHPYYWMGNTTVNAKIRSMAKAKYVDSGYSKAKSIIDSMPEAQVKAYLKQLIEDNVDVGVAIIKSKQ